MTNGFRAALLSNLLFLQKTLLFCPSNNLQTGGNDGRLCFWKGSNHPTRRADRQTCTSGAQRQHFAGLPGSTQDIHQRKVSLEFSISMKSSSFSHCKGKNKWPLSTSLPSSLSHNTIYALTVTSPVYTCRGNSNLWPMGSLQIDIQNHQWYVWDINLLHLYMRLTLWFTKQEWKREQRLEMDLIIVISWRGLISAHLNRNNSVYLLRDNLLASKLLAKQCMYLSMY